MLAADATTSSAKHSDTGLSWHWGTPYREFAAEWIESGMMEAHWRESGTFNDVLTMDCDHRYYQGMEVAGQLEILVVRDDAGVMVGYMILLKNRYPRDRQATVGTIDMVYVDPPFRSESMGGGLGWKMMKAGVERLKAAGVNIAFLREKSDHRGGHLIRLGRSLGVRVEKLSTTWGAVLNPPARR